MFCPQCGTKNTESSQFCGNCGYQFIDRPEKKEKSIKTGQKTSWLLPALIAVFLLASAITAVFVFDVPYVSDFIDDPDFSFATNLIDDLDINWPDWMPWAEKDAIGSRSDDNAHAGADTDDLAVDEKIDETQEPDGETGADLDEPNEPEPQAAGEEMREPRRYNQPEIHGIFTRQHS